MNSAGRYHRVCAASTPAPKRKKNKKEERANAPELTLTVTRGRYVSFSHVSSSSRAAAAIAVAFLLAQSRDAGPRRWVLVPIRGSPKHPTQGSDPGSSSLTLYFSLSDACEGAPGSARHCGLNGYKTFVVFVFFFFFFVLV